MQKAFISSQLGKLSQNTDKLYTVLKIDRRSSMYSVMSAKYSIIQYYAFNTDLYGRVVEILNRIVVH